MSRQGIEGFVHQLANQPSLAALVRELADHPDADTQIVDVAGQNGHEITAEEWHASQARTQSAPR
jgi:hypothetical protein